MQENFFRERLHSLNQAYDEAEGMILRDNRRTPGYHTRLSGPVHSTLEIANYAELVYYLREEALYPRAARGLYRLACLQDTRKGSKTQGLWSYFAEEGLDEMLAPDYNWTDFICRHIAFILKKRADCIDDDLRRTLTRTMRLGAECSLRRNVGADYTNITMMSSNTIIAAAEIADDKELLARGRARLAHFLEYNTHCGVFTEYNSPAYTPLALEEISRMLLLFEDRDCLRLAEALNDIGWRTLATHYHANQGQMMPPHMRAYTELTPKSVLSLIYLGTDGKYGALRKEDVAMTRLPYRCPEKYHHYFAPITEPREITEPCYRKNSIRRPDEDVTIVRNFDSPDLLTYSYATPTYSMGAFRVCDTWVQRHNAMVIFGDPSEPTTLRLRCIKRNTEEKDYPLYDTCMGFAAVDMKRSVMLGSCGLTVDHGDFHYILDKVKNGVYELEELVFCFDLGGNTEGVEVQMTERGCRLEKNGTSVYVALYGGRFDGAPMEIRYLEEEKRLCAVCYSGIRRQMALADLADATLTFTLSVNAPCPAPEIREENGVRYATLGDLSVASYLRPCRYDDAVALSAPTPSVP